VCRTGSFSLPRAGKRAGFLTSPPGRVSRISPHLVFLVFWFVRHFRRPPSLCTSPLASAAQCFYGAPGFLPSVVAPLKVRSSPHPNFRGLSFSCCHSFSARAEMVCAGVGWRLSSRGGDGVLCPSIPIGLVVFFLPSWRPLIILPTRYKPSFGLAVCGGPLCMLPVCSAGLSWWLRWPAARNRFPPRQACQTFFAGTARPLFTPVASPARLPMGPLAQGAVKAQSPGWSSHFLPDGLVSAEGSFKGFWRWASRRVGGRVRYLSVSPPPAFSPPFSGLFFFFFGFLRGMPFFWRLLGCRGLFFFLCRSLQGVAGAGPAWLPDLPETKKTSGGSLAACSAGVVGSHP